MGTEDRKIDHESLPILLQEPQGLVMYWEKFLPSRSIKVLLVEHDDSTRHVVSALLRKCSYEVTAVSNGLQAWKKLEDSGNHIDIILTEVAMPILSGISLLCKIMSHKTLKNIPVIMMSSHDSMGIVFKCLSKGAVDFLVKPIRRNELKNIWQHFWRRSHSSSGSGSESGTHTRKFAKSRSNDAAQNNGDNSVEHVFRSKGLSVQDGSDNGGGNQSSPHKQLVAAHDSKCAQAMHTKPEIVSSRRVHATDKECHELSDQIDDVARGKDLDMQISLNMQLEHSLEELSTNPTGKSLNKLSDVDGKQLNKGHSSNGCEKGQLVYSSDKTRTLKDQAVNVVAGDGRTVLRHSDLSGFSKYNTASSANQAQTGNVGSCSPLENGSVAPNAETMHNFPSNSNGTPNQQSNGSNNINDMASTNTYLNTKPETYDKKSDSVTGIVSFNSSAFQTAQTNSISSLQLKISAQEENAEIAEGQVRGSSKEGFQVKNNHCQLHHYGPIVHNAAQDHCSDHDDLMLKNLTKASEQCVSSILFREPAKSDASNYSVNGNAIESDHGSSGQNGSNTSLITRMIYEENDRTNSGNGNGADDRQIVLREFALNKFRQKRKERCFEKRVRYSSRQKLAEQRPRIKGQFVPRTVSDTKEEYDTQQ